MAGPRGSQARLRGLTHLKTASKARIRSKPKILGQEYLDMYLAIKNQERLERFKETLEKTHGGADEQLRDVRLEIEKLGKIVGKYADEDVDFMKRELEKRKLEKNLEKEKKEVLKVVEKKLKAEQEGGEEKKEGGLQIKKMTFQKKVPDKPFGKMDLDY